MRRAFLCGGAVAIVSLIAGSRNASGAWLVRRRRRNRLPCIPPTEVPKRAVTVEELATLLVELKGKIDISVPNDAREELNAVLDGIMGDSNAIFQAVGRKVVVDRQRVDRRDIETLFGGEVRAISEELRRRSVGNG